MRTNRRIGAFGNSDVRQTKIHTTEPLVPDPSFFDLKLLLKSCKLRGTDKVPLELLQTEGHTLHSEVHTLVYSLLTFQ